MARRIGRRIFLHTTGGALLGLPFLQSLVPVGTAAQVAVTKRFVGILSQSGQFVTDWYPTATPPGYALRDELYGGDRSDGTTAPHETMPGTPHKWAPLADFAASGVSTVIPAALNPYLSKMLLLRGLDLLQGTSHGSGMFLGNLAACSVPDEFSSRGLGEIPTIDQVLAYSDRFYAAPPRARSLVLATGSQESISFSDYGMGGGVESVPATLDPQNLWDDLFAGFMPPGMSPETPREDPNRLLMNALHADYQRIRDHRRMSAEDRMLLERHIAFLSDIERELVAGVATVGASCTPPARPPSGRVGRETTSAAELERAVRLLVDVAVAAIRCDLTRVVTLNCNMGVTDASGTPATSYHSSADTTGDWHQFAHEAQGDALHRAHLVSLNKWVVTKVFARFLEQLDVEETAGTTFLDNSLVLLGSELSLDHYSVSQPTLIAGGAGGALRTGYYVDYSQMSGHVHNGTLPWGVRIPGLPYNRLYTTVLQAMGLSPADYERGQPGYGHVESFGMPYAWPDDAYDMGQIGAPLPGIFVA